MDAILRCACLILPDASFQLLRYAQKTKTGEAVSTTLVCQQNVTTGTSTATVQAVYEVLTASVAVFVMYMLFIQFFYRLNSFWVSFRCIVSTFYRARLVIALFPVFLLADQFVSIITFCSVSVFVSSLCSC